MWIRASLPFVVASREAGRDLGELQRDSGGPWYSTWVAVKELLANVKLTHYERTVHRASF